MYLILMEDIGSINVFVTSIYIPGGQESKLPTDSHLYQQYNIICNYLN